MSEDVFAGYANFNKPPGTSRFTGVRPYDSFPSCRGQELREKTEVDA